MRPWTKQHALAIAQTATAVLVFVLLTETGARSRDGNFFWPIVPTFYILIMVLMRDVFMQPGTPSRRATWLLAAHVASGAGYIVHSVLNGPY